MYFQGASVIRMLQEMMGSESFFTGIEKYLIKYEWGTAKTDDLWAELGQVSIAYVLCNVFVNGNEA